MEFGVFIQQRVNGFNGFDVASTDTQMDSQRWGIYK